MMASSPDGAFVHPTRRLIATSCRAQPKTISAIARELGRTEGGLRATVLAMASEDVLEPVKGRRAGSTAYLLRTEWHEALDEATSRHGIPGLMIEGQRLLLIERRAAGTVAAALADSPLRENLAWGAQLAGDEPLDGLLLAFDEREDRDEFDEFLDAVEELGVRRIRTQVAKMRHAREIREYLTRRTARGPA